MRKYHFVIFLATFFIWMVGCGEKKPTAQSQDQPQSAEEQLNFDQSLPFPHTSNWSNPDVHGVWVMRNGPDTCFNCHKTESAQPETPPTCSSCHSLFPHPSNWATFEGHGSFVLTTLSSNTTVCKSCHGEDLRGGAAQVSCNLCHTNYPHPANWATVDQHGPAAYGLGKVTCASANCHGTNFQGGPRAPACATCHANYPHTNTRWMNPDRTSNASGRDENFHGDLFIRKIGRGETNPCSECHGTNYDRSVGGARCLTCHARGITHRVPPTPDARPWNNSHGRFFSSQFNSTSTDTNCEHCHGAAVGFNSTQTASMLAAQSECYRCHKAYPHKNYLVPPTTFNWEPIFDNCGNSTGNAWAHPTYLLDRVPTFTDAAGRRPPENLNDPLNLAAVQNSCGGSTEGSCHFNGNRSYRRGGSLLCTGSCHSASRPIMPAVPSCPPQPLGGGGGGSGGGEIPEGE